MLNKEDHKTDILKIVHSTFDPKGWEEMKDQDFDRAATEHAAFYSRHYGVDIKVNIPPEGNYCYFLPFGYEFYIDQPKYYS